MHEMIRRRCEPQARRSSLPVALIPSVKRFTYLAWTPYYLISPQRGIDAMTAPPCLKLEACVS